MIIVDNKPFDIATLSEQYAKDSVESAVLQTIASSGEKYSYDSLGALEFELRVRAETVRAAKELYHSDFAFEVFRDSKCNPDYWIRRNDGGFELKSSVQPAAAVRDIFRHSSKYGTECATAIQIIYLKALLEAFPEDEFNRMFRDLYLMNWHKVTPMLREIGVMRRVADKLIGDRRYFKNPDVDPKTPEWQGENVIDMGNGLYYGHGIGIGKAEKIIRELNENRREDADREAYLMDSVARLDFKRLAVLFEKATQNAIPVRHSA